MSPPIAADPRTKITAYADRFANLLENHKADVAALVEEVKGDDLDAGMLRKLVAFMRKDETAREEQEAVFDQYRFLAGLLPTPAEIPAESELARAAALFADNMTIRAVATEMGISVGKAHALKVKAAAFDVHVHLNVNVPAGSAEEITPKLKPACIIPRPDTWKEITSARDAAEAEREAIREAARAKRRAERAAFDARNAAIDADPLTLPPRLDRRPTVTT